VECSGDAIISKDLAGVITSWNQSAERLFGYKAGEIIGRHVTILIPEDRRHEEEHILGRVLRGERVENYETVRRRKDGGLIDISLTVSPIKAAEGQIIGFSKIARDVTERKDHFLATLSHELRTPLSPVLLVAGAAADNPALPENVRSDAFSQGNHSETESYRHDRGLGLGLSISRNKAAFLAHLTKPVRFDQLEEILDDVFARRPNSENRNL
jgi:PAS domain S-box-containing protein